MFCPFLIEGHILPRTDLQGDYKNIHGSVRPSTGCCFAQAFNSTFKFHVPAEYNYKLKGLNFIYLLASKSMQCFITPLLGY